MMNLKTWKTAACTGALGAISLLASAAPLNRAEVAANPTWVAHLDCDALRPTTIGKYILAEMDKPEARAKLADFQSMFDLDLRTQLHGVTLYGVKPGPDDAVLIVYAEFDADRLVELAKARDDAGSTPHGSVVIYNWIDENRKARNGEKPRVYGAIQGKRVILGRREDSVARALDVLAGSAASLATDAAFPELGKSGSGHFIEAATRKMNLPDADPNAAIMKTARTIQVVMGESNQQFKGAVTLVADNEEGAEHVQSIAQGLLALAKLQTDKPAATKFASAVSLKQDGSRVVGSLVLPAGEMVEILKANAERKAARQAKAPQDQP
jgi:hypothetical protein